MAGSLYCGHLERTAEVPKKRSLFSLLPTFTQLPPTFPKHQVPTTDSATQFSRAPRIPTYCFLLGTYCYPPLTAPVLFQSWFSHWTQGSGVIQWSLVVHSAPTLSLSWRTMRIYYVQAEWLRGGFGLNQCSSSVGSLKVWKTKVICNQTTSRELQWTKLENGK